MLYKDYIIKFTLYKVQKYYTKIIQQLSASRIPVKFYQKSFKDV